MEILERLDQIIGRLELAVAALGQTSASQEWFTTDEVAKLLGKRPFTIREYCRLKRLNARKRQCGRGTSPAWMISQEELDRYRNEGLLPLPKSQTL